MEKFIKRLHTLLLKLTGFEGLVWVTATVAFFMKILDGSMWIGLSVAVAGIKTYQKQKNIAEELK